MGALEGTAKASVLKGAKVLMRMDVEVIVAMLSQHEPQTYCSSTVYFYKLGQFQI